MGSLLITGLFYISLWFGRSYAEVQTIEAFFLLGGTLELQPPPGTKDITGVQWRHNENIVAEWSGKAVDTWGQFKNRAILDTATGYLTIPGLTNADAGAYTIEINDRRLEVKYDVKVLKEVPKPDVWVKPLDEKSRELVCEGVVEGAEPVTYLWIFGGNRTWVELGQKIVMQNNETTRLVETFTCKIKNPVSEKESAPKENPFFAPPSASGALGALVLIPIAIVLIGLGYWKRDDIKARLCSGQNGSNGGGSGNTPENVHLNGSPENGQPSPPAGGGDQ